MVTTTADGDEGGDDSKGSESDGGVQYSPIISAHSSTRYNASLTDDEDYCERTSLIGSHRSSRNRSKAPFPGIRPRSISATRSVSISETASSTLSIWNLTKTQKIVLVTTCLCDFLAFLSVSLMAPFFPEENAVSILRPLYVSTEHERLYQDGVDSIVVGWSVFLRLKVMQQLHKQCSMALKKEVSDTLSGWIFGAAPFTQCLISPVFGKLIPYAGVKFMFISGLFLFGGCTFLFGFLSYVPSTNGNGMFIALAFLLQVFRSAGVACSSTASFVLMMQEFPDNVATVFGLGEIFVGLGLVLGPAVGGILYGMDGFYLPFVSIGGLALFCVPFMLWTVPSVTNAEIDNGNENLPIRKILCSPEGFIISACVIVGTAMWSILDPTLEPHLRQYNLTPELVGVIFLVMAAVYALSAPVWGWMADKMDDQRLFLSLGFVGACVGSLLIGPSPLLGFAIDFNELWLVVVSLVILGASASLSTVPTFDMYFTLAEDLGYEDDTRTYSMVAGLWMSMYSFGDFIGPSVGGALSDLIGFSNMCTYIAAMCLFMAFILVVNRLCDLKCCKRRPRAKTDDKAIQKINEAYESFNDHPCYGSSGHSSVLA